MQFHIDLSKDLESLHNQLDRIESLLTSRPQPVKKQREKSDKIMNVTETAAFLNVSKQHVYHLVHQGNIPHCKIGKRTLFRQRDIEGWIAKRYVKTNAEIEQEADLWLLRNPHSNKV